MLHTYIFHAKNLVQKATLVEVEESSRQVQSNTASAASNDDLSNQAPHVHARFAPAPIGE